MPEPDFDRFRAALLGRRPDRLPLGEMHADLEVKEAFLGRPVRTLEDEVDFWFQAGYDYVCLPMGVMYAEVVGTRLRRSDLGTAYRGRAHTAA